MGRSDNSSDSGSTRKKETPRKLTRSVRLRKYEAAYKSCLQLTSESQGRRKSEKKSRASKQIVREEYSKRSLPSSSHKEVRDTSRRKEKESTTPKRPLNAYQMFLQSESKREKYKAKSPKSRMSAIAAAWKRKQGDDSGEKKEKRKAGRKATK